VIVGLGQWAGRQEWSLAWLTPADGAKIFGVTFTTVYSETLHQSWERVAVGVEAVLAAWSGRSLSSLQQRARAIETLAFSKIWYLAQILPLSQVTAAGLERAAGNFLWRGRLERLAWG
jgi:hypothetical protein